MAAAGPTRSPARRKRTSSRAGRADTLVGGDGDDTFVFNSAAELSSSENVDGGNGTADTLRVNVSSSSILGSPLGAVITGVEKAVFVPAAGNLLLGGDNLGTAAGLINEITGSTGVNGLLVFGSDIDLSGVIFNAWTAGEDPIILLGSAGDDTITGSSKADTITGGTGVDTLVGGDGDDTFVYNSSTEFSPGGETIAGGNGTADTLRINVGEGLQINVSGAGALSGVEKLVFTSAGVGKFSGVNLGTATGLVNAVTGSAGENRVTSRSGSNIDLTGVGFTAWTAGEDLINFVGTGGNDTIVGSSQNDIFGGEGGIDSLSGGGGDDVFNLKSDDFVVGSSINGGSGADDVLRAGWSREPSGLIHSDDSQIGRSSSSSRHESRDSRQRHAGRSPSA